MLSLKHSETARINGALSRGPVTPEGKAISSRNAIRHGLLAGTIVLPNEDEKLFEELFYLLIESFHPRNDAEMSMIEEMAASCWRARRACAMERAIFQAGIQARPDLSPIEQTTAAYRDPANKEDLSRLQRYEARLQNIYHRTVRGIAHIRRVCAENPPLPNEPNLGGIPDEGSTL